MNSKYFVFALAFILTFSAVSSAFALTTTTTTFREETGTYLPPASVDLHGPLISSVTFSVISVESSLAALVDSGAIQAPEWTFTTATEPGVCTSVVLCGSTTGYTWDGIAFNTAPGKGPVANEHFRQAIGYLTDYCTGAPSICSANTISDGETGPSPLPCYPPGPYSYTGCAAPTVPANFGVYTATCSACALAAATQLAQSGLYAWISGVLQVGTPATIAAAVVANPSHTVWSTSNTSPTVYTPLFYFRIDDPLREAPALQLCANALAAVGLSIGCTGITGAEAGGDVYGPAIGESVATTYDPATGYNTCTSTTFATCFTGINGGWDMYTFGWITSASMEAQAEFWNSAFLGSTVNFANYYNTTMDYASNALLYATCGGTGAPTPLCASPTTPSGWGASYAANQVAQAEVNGLPYLVWFFQSTNYADYAYSWTGYAQEPATGPDTTGGLYNTLLNVHETNNMTGGNLNLALHEEADVGGMNPIYNTNWVWQADIWSEMYDTPLATPPTMFTTANAFMNYMTTNYGTAGVFTPCPTPVGGIKTATCPVTSYSGPLPTGSGVYKYQTGVSGTPTTITNGEVITFIFDNNLTFSDNTAFTAKDYQYDLVYWNIALNTVKYPDLDTPDNGLLAGPYGLIASQTIGTNEIQIYINSNSVWNLASAVVPVMSYGVLSHFSIDHMSTAIVDLNTPEPYLYGGTAYTISGAAPGWMWYLPNLEIGTGPYTMTSYSTYGPTSGSGTLAANINYFRTAWYDQYNFTTPGFCWGNCVGTGSSYTYTFTIQQPIFNPYMTPSGTYCSVPYGSTGDCPITGKSPTAMATAGSWNSAQISAFGTCGTSPAWSLAVPCGSAVAKTKVVELVYHGTVSATKYNLVQVGDTDQYTVTIPASALTNIAAACTPPPEIPNVACQQGQGYELVLSTTYTFQGLARVWYQAVGFVVVPNTIEIGPWPLS